MGFMDELADMANSLAGFFRSTLGATDTTLLATGTPATGIITSLTPTGTTITIMNGLTERICTIGLTVMVPGKDPYEVTVTQGLPEIWIPLLSSNPRVAVKVDPTDALRVAIDVNAGAATGAEPTTLPSKPADDHDSAAWILANGTPVTVVVDGMRPLPGVRNAAGDDVYVLSLTVEAGDGGAPYRVQVGNAVPAASLALVTAGSRLQAKRGDDPGDIVVDWTANGPAPTTIV